MCLVEVVLRRLGKDKLVLHFLEVVGKHNNSQDKANHFSAGPLNNLNQALHYLAVLQHSLNKQAQSGVNNLNLPNPNPNNFYRCKTHDNKLSTQSWDMNNSAL